MAAGFGMGARTCRARSDVGGYVVHVRWWVAIVVWAAGATAGAQPRPMRVSWPVPAMAARLFDRTLVVLSPDLLFARAIDLGDDRVIWEARIQDEPRGTHDVQPLPNGRVLVIAGPRLVVLEAATGAVVARHELREEFHRAFLWEENGLCGMNTECAFQLIDCEDARPLGEPLRGQIQHRRPVLRTGPTAGHHTGCWSFRVRLVGRRRDLLLVDVRNLARTGASDQVHPHATRTTVRVYVDARTGAVRSQRPIADRQVAAQAPASGPTPPLEVVRDYNGGARRAHVRRVSDGAVLARYDTDAWSLGDWNGRTVVLVYAGTGPSEIRIVRHDAARLP